MQTKEIKNGSVWVPLDGITKGFVTVTRKEGPTVHYKHTDDNERISHFLHCTTEDAFLRHFRGI